MSELDKVKERIEAALVRIENVGAGSDRLEIENGQLKAQIKTMKAKRTEELAELDELLRQLKPMMQEDENAGN